METESNLKKKRRPVKKVILWILAILFVILSIATIYVMRNFNQILADALMKSFNSSVVSDVYELKFEKLRVNVFSGNVKVLNVTFLPREKPLHPYPYINSSIQLTTSKIILEDLQIMTLVKTGKLELKRIEIDKPEIEVSLKGEVHKFLPYKDTLAAKDTAVPGNKKFLTAFSLEEFRLIDASFHILNFFTDRELNVKKLSISLNDLKIDQQTGLDFFAINKVALKIAAISGSMKSGGFRTLSLSDLSLNVMDLEIRKTADTLIFTYADFDTGLKNLSMDTKDSVYNVSVQSFGISRDKASVNIEKFVFKPNLTQAELLKREKYQKAQFSVSVGSLDLNNVNFDTLVYRRKLLVDEIKINKVDVSLFKDKSKPVNRNNFPEYLGQKIAAIPFPLSVKLVSASEVNLVNVERKEDGKSAKVIVQRGKLEVKNITNLSTAGLLTLQASAYIENKVLIHLYAAYSYTKPQFSISVKAGKFNLLDLNQLLLAYTPAKISKGTVDQISLTGAVYRTTATGTMKFLYHDLSVDLKLTDKNWQNSVVGFAANTYLSTHNPPSAGIPPKVVKYQVERDMNKGGFNIILKSFLAGMKETMIMSKENKQDYKEKKKAARADKKAAEGDKTKWNPLKKK